nr:MAG TPA: hypothetical protein [Caudoviricetes sp.]
MYIINVIYNLKLYSSQGKIHEPKGLKRRYLL